MVKIIAYEGNIASGKSRYFEAVNYFRPDIKTFPEPLEEWRNYTAQDCNVYDLFAALSSNTKSTAFSFQIAALNSHIQTIKRAAMVENEYAILERCYMSNKEIFSRFYYDKGIISSQEWTIYNKILEDNLTASIAGVVYVYTSPEKCYERLQHRNRKDEVDSVTLTYLKSLNDYYDKWIKRCSVPVLTVENCSEKANHDDYANDMRCLSEFIASI